MESWGLYKWPKNTCRKLRWFHPSPGNQWSYFIYFHHSSSPNITLYEKTRPPKKKIPPFLSRTFRSKRSGTFWGFGLMPQETGVVGHIPPPNDPLVRGSMEGNFTTWLPLVYIWKFTYVKYLYYIHRLASWPSTKTTRHKPRWFESVLSSWFLRWSESVWVFTPLSITKMKKICTNTRVCPPTDPLLSPFPKSKNKNHITKQNSYLQAKIRPATCKQKREKLALFVKIPFL